MDRKEEDEDLMALLNYRSPKGQLIKLVEQKMKKPEIDDSLGKILDQFSDITHEQTTFLDNGVFHMNFAEDALLLQACGRFYGKRVDKLWTELLEFHTRLVKHGEHAAKHCTNRKEIEARNTEVTKLEERVNRGKRKKIQIVEKQDIEDVPLEGEGEYFIIATADESEEIFDDRSFRFFDEEDEEGEEGNKEEERTANAEPAPVPFKFVSTIFSKWEKIQEKFRIEAERNLNSLFVAHYHHLRYRFKPYGIPSGREMIFDAGDPEEFNVREGRLISCHHIRHLFDDNDRCLIPDEKYLIARLRVTYVLRKKFLLSNKIHPAEPYENYREPFENYLIKFLERENRKIQNMPQATSDQFITFLKALARKEQLAYEKVEKLKEMGVKDLPPVCFDTVIVEPAKDGYEGIFDPYIPDEFYTPKPVNILDLYGGIEFYPDDESNAEFNLMMKTLMNYARERDTPENTDEDPEAEISSLLENMPDNPDPSTSEAEQKGRADSGYFDGGFADEDESVCGDQSEAPVAGTETPFEFDKDSSTNKEGEVHEAEPVLETAELETSKLPTEDKTSEQNNIIDISQCIESGIETSTASDLEQFTSSTAMNEKLKKLSMCASEDHQEIIYRTLEDCYFDDSHQVITIVYNKQEMLDKKSVKVLKKQKAVKRKEDVEETVFHPVKRRRLSQKQVAKLKESVIKPIRELKWEYFYSLNYQPESGEGEVEQLNWEESVGDEAGDSDEDCTDEGGQVNNEALNEADNREETGNECHPESTTIPNTLDSGIETLGEVTRREEDESASDAQDNNKATKTAVTTPSVPTSKSLITDSFEKVLEKMGVMGEEMELPDTERVIEMTPHEKEMHESRKRVAEWREFITPKLKQLNDQDFDIHEYGSKMMDDMEVNESRPFADFVAGKSPAEVVRYFVSSLQLANTSNVEICGAKPGELSNDTFELKLLSKDRYHEHLQDYQAPSEEGLKDKLLKIKEIRQQNKISKKKNGTKRANEAKVPKPLKKMKILKISLSQCNQVQNCDPQEPCSSRQADERERNNSINACLDDIEQTANRASIDSGCMPACDDEFLAQFDQLQSISEGNVQST